MTTQLPPIVYTTDWTGAFVSNATKLLVPRFAGKPCRYLEIGVFEGRSGGWMLDKVLTHADSRYVGIDTWARWALHPELDMEKVYARAVANLSRHGKKVEIHRGPSRAVLPKLPLNGFDVVYVDGQHSGPAPLIDMMLAWLRVKKGGLMVLDDVAPAWPDIVEAASFFLERQTGGHKELLRNSQVWIQRV